MKRLHVFIIAVIISLGLHAQSDNEQVLVFRHSGVVNLFYASQLDSITLSYFDADSILHDELVSQVFYAKDTTMVVPIVEIDSVAFGSRNKAILNKAVHQLTDHLDIPWITDAKGCHLFYRKDTPEEILPKLNEKLYYAESNHLMPAGLAAQVASVTSVGDAWDVELAEVDLNEIFDDLFYAGRVITKNSKEDAAKRVSKSRAPGERDVTDIYTEPIPLDNTLHLGRFGEIEVNGETDISADFVINVRRHYYHAHVRGETNIGFDWKLQSEDSGHEEMNTQPIRIPLPVIGGVLHPVIYANLFSEVTAELLFTYTMQRNYIFEFEWTRQNGVNSVKNMTPTGEDLQGLDKAKMELLLNGEIFGGGELGMEMNLAGDRVGVRFGLKAGPFMSGNLGFGILTQLREYNPNFYHLAQIDFGLKMKVNISTFDHEYFWLFGDEVEHPLYEHSFTLFKHTEQLFPEFEQTRGVEATTRESTEVTTATVVNNNIPYQIETGFELLDKDNEIVDSVFVESPIEAKRDDVQGFEAQFEIPKQTEPHLNPLQVRPIFHYAGHTISSTSTPVLHDSFLMPITSYGTNGIVTFISGASVVGTAKSDSTIYHIGNYLPIPLQDSVFYDSGFVEPKKPGEHIDENKKEDIIGTWIGEFDNDNVILTFNDDNEQTGTYTLGNNTRNFIYDLNTPQSGDISILLDDNHIIVITLISVNDTELRIRMKGSQKEYILYRQY